MLDPLIWGSVGAAGIGLAWGLDAWAERKGRSRMLALLGLLPVLVYALVVLGLFGPRPVAHAYGLVTEALRVERMVARLLASAGGIGAAVIVGLLARRGWSHARRRARWDLGPGLVAVAVGTVGLVAALGGSLVLGSVPVVDVPFVFSAVVLLVAVLSGVLGAGPDAAPEARHRLDQLVLVGVAGVLVAVSHVGRFWEATELPWWTIGRSARSGVVLEGALVGLVVVAAPLLAAAVALLPHARALRPTHAVSLGAAGVALLGLALPVPWVAVMLADQAQVFDFADVAGDVDLPTSADTIVSPAHGCVWRWTPAGGEWIATQDRVAEPDCSDPAQQSAEFLVAPAHLTLDALPPGSTAAASTQDQVDVDIAGPPHLALLVRTEQPVPFPFRIYYIEHHADGTPMAGRTLQEVLDTCSDAAVACNLEPWAR